MKYRFLIACLALLTTSEGFATGRARKNEFPSLQEPEQTALVKERSGHQCNHLLSPRAESSTRFIPSQQGTHGEAELNKKYALAIQEIFGKGGVADQLGLSLPPHTVEFMPSGQLSLLATLGRHPIGHWNDGNQLMERIQDSGGVLEFVTPGCPTCRSYYSDNTHFENQLSVLMHVAGHNDMAANSMYQLIRGADPIVESLKLYEIMEDAYRKYGHEKVSLFYQQLSSLQYFQDIARGTFEAPEIFDPKNGGLKKPTASGLQAMVFNLPENAPEWQKEILFHFERMNRTVGYYASTKIMNEGWATLMMEVLAGHSQWTTTHDAVELAQLLLPVAGIAKLDNPYWLGREAWRAIRAKFNARPEIQGLAPIERDRQFVAFAKDHFIKYRNDYDFLREALDDHWVRSQRFFLSKKLTDRREWDDQLPPSEDERLRQQFEVASTEPADIRDYIATKVADRSLQIPRILVKNLHATAPQGDTDIVLLEHELNANLPLEPKSTAQTLYIMSQIFQRPVRIETYFGDVFNQGEVDPVRVQVDPDGKLSFYTFSYQGVEIDGNNGFAQDMQKAVRSLRADLLEEDAIAQGMVPSWTTKWAGEIVNQNLTRGIQAANHIPTAPRALLEFANFMQLRLAKKLELFFKGQLKYQVTQAGIQISVLPPIPYFQLNTKFQHKEKGQKFSIELQVNPEAKGDVGLGKGGKRQGDKFWGPNDPPHGSGKGDSEGEEGDDPGNSKKAGDGTSKPITIPLEIYGKMLQEFVELPNLQPKAGITENVETEREGGIRKNTGEILWGRMMEKILALGTIALKKQGIENPDRNEVIREGLKYITEADYVVVDRVEHPLPDVNAVIVIARDMSGSMNGDPTTKIAEFLFNLKALLQSRYKNIKFRFIGFDTTAVEFSEKDFFSQSMGGGTHYFSGVDKAVEILQEYPEERWDRYFFLAGDADDGKAIQSVQSLEKIKPMIQYGAFIHTVIPSETGDRILLAKVKDWAGEMKSYFGYAKLGNELNAGIQALRQLFGKK